MTEPTVPAEPTVHPDFIDYECLYPDLGYVELAFVKNKGLALWIDGVLRWSSWEPQAHAVAEATASSSDNTGATPAQKP